MSQTKVQLIQPIGIMTAPGVNVSGTLTATTFDGNLVGAAGSIAGTPNVNAGIFTATSFYGSGSGLSGVPSGPAYVGQSTAAQSGTTTIDLSTGNVIYFTQDTNTTVAFANTESVQEVRFIRVKDDTTTARTIAWPASIIWNGGTTPTLIDSDQTGDVQIFNLTTRDQGVTWYGYETMKNDPATPIGLYVWGNAYGGLGLNEPSALDRSSPTQIPGAQWSYLGLGGNSSDTFMATKTDGTLWVWGDNDSGNMGLGSLVPRSSPVQLPGTQWSRVQPQRYGTSYFTKTDGTLWTVGNNTLGQLAQNDKVDRSSPIQVPGTQWDYESLSANYGQGFCKKTDGTLWAWGYNYHGQLGQNNRIWRSSPVAIAGTQWATIKATYGIQVATKTDGTLWTWGQTGGLFSNSYNSPARLSSPTQIPGTNWSTGEFALGGDRYVVRALKTDGTLWTWGFNGNGQLGQNNVVHYSSPIQIPGTQWKSVNTSSSSNQSFVGGFCTKTDGTLWVWGSNNEGRLGLNDVINRSSPYQIPGTNWQDGVVASTAAVALG